MTATSHDRSLEDQGNILALEHLNVQIDDQRLATLFYIGALGSRKTHAKRVERMMAEGFSQEDLSRIHAPIGLDIGSVSPAEIAVSVLGEIIAALRKKPLRAEPKA